MPDTAAESVAADRRAKALTVEAASRTLHSERSIHLISSTFSRYLMIVEIVLRSQVSLATNGTVGNVACVAQLDHGEKREEIDRLMHDLKQCCHFLLRSLGDSLYKCRGFGTDSMLLNRISTGRKVMNTDRVIARGV